MTLTEIIYFNKIRKLKKVHREILEINSINYTKTKNVLSERLFVRKMLNKDPITIYLTSINVTNNISKNRLYLHILKILQDYNMDYNITIRYSTPIHIKISDILILDI